MECVGQFYLYKLGKRSFRIAWASRSLCYRDYHGRKRLREASGAEAVRELHQQEDAPIMRRYTCALLSGPAMGVVIYIHVCLLPRTNIVHVCEEVINVIITRAPQPLPANSVI
jgi:hypothetical protein